MSSLLSGDGSAIAEANGDLAQRTQSTSEAVVNTRGGPPVIGTDIIWVNQAMPAFEAGFADASPPKGAPVVAGFRDGAPKKKKVPFTFAGTWIMVIFSILRGCRIPTAAPGKVFVFQGVLTEGPRQPPD
jgi:hypothetical protein